MRRTRLLSTLAFVLALGLAGCSQSGDNPGVASLDEPSAGETSDDVSDDPDKQIEKFEECMADHGIDMEDQGMISRPGSGMRTEERSTDDPGQADNPAEQEGFDEALAECEKYMPTPELSAEDEARMREQALAYVECVRDKGFDIPDPKIEGGGIGMDLGGTGIDPEDPAFRKADEECMKEHMGVVPGEGVQSQERSS